jgi:hypothetical protein
MLISPPQQSVADHHHILSPTSSQSDLGPLALAEAFQATFVRIMLLGFWKGLLGSLAVLWMVLGATTGCILSIGLWLRRKENDLRERDRRWEVAQAREAGFQARQRSSGRRVRWLDEVEGRHELEKTMDVRCEVLKVDDGLAVDMGDLGMVCQECLMAKID